MSKNKYLEIIGAGLAFIPKHWGIITFLIFAAFLFYVATMSINIVAAISTVPSMEEVNKKFFTVKIRTDIIDDIEKFSEEKTRRQFKYSESPTDRNPFLPYIVEPATTSTPLPVVSPNTQPVVSPDISN